LPRRTASAPLGSENLVGGSGEKFVDRGGSEFLFDAVAVGWRFPARGRR